MNIIIFEKTEYTEDGSGSTTVLDNRPLGWMLPVHSAPVAIVRNGEIIQWSGQNYSAREVREYTEDTSGIGRRFDLDSAGRIVRGKPGDFATWDDFEVIPADLIDELPRIDFDAAREGGLELRDISSVSGNLWQAAQTMTMTMKERGASFEDTRSLVMRAFGSEVWNDPSVSQIGWNQQSK